MKPSDAILDCDNPGLCVALVDPSIRSNPHVVHLLRIGSDRDELAFDRVQRAENG